MAIVVWCNVTAVILTIRASYESIQNSSNYSSRFLISNLQTATQLTAKLYFNLLHSKGLSCPVFFKTENYCK